MNGNSGQAPRKPTILIVDDEVSNLQLMAEILEGQYRVRAVRSGDKALKIAGTRPQPDLLLLDIMMPGMNGLQVLKQLRADASTREIPTIFVTALDKADCELRGLDMGAVDYITKPINSTLLLARVRTQLALKQARDQLRRQARELDVQVKARTAQLQTAMEKLNLSHQVLKKHFSDTVRAFSHLVDLREGVTSGHSRRVAEWARSLGRELGMEDKALQDLVFAALLLQVGKISLPDKLVGRPVNALFKLEREAYLRHATVGASVLKDIEPLKQVARLIAMQYECYDGSGIPNGLVGDDIPLGARLLSVVRDYDLMLEGNMSGKAMMASEAQAQLRRLGGKKYDPKMVDAMIQLVGEARDEVYRPVIEAATLDLVEGMEVVEVIYNNQVFLRDVVLTQAMIEELQQLQKTAGTSLTVKVRARK